MKQFSVSYFGCCKKRVLSHIFTDFRIIGKAKKPIEESHNGNVEKTLLVTGLKSSSHTSCSDDHTADSVENRVMVPVQEQTTFSQQRSELTY